jgi:hypothetical protein
LSLFRNSVLVLPTSFLLGALIFILTHGRNQPGYEAFPFLRDLLGPSRIPSTPELRFLVQAGLVFLPAYLFVLVILLLTAAAERAIFGPAPARGAGLYGRALAPTYLVFYFLATVVIVLGTGSVRRVIGSDFPVAPAVVAAAPFLAAFAALPAAAIAALIVAAGLRVAES